MIMFITILLNLVRLSIYRMGYTVEKGETQNLVYSHTHRVFVGPKIRKDLELRADNLELSIDMGWFWFISQPMVLVLDLILWDGR